MRYIACDEYQTNSFLLLLLGSSYNAQNQPLTGLASCGELKFGRITIWGKNNQTKFLKKNNRSLVFNDVSPRVEMLQPASRYERIRVIYASSFLSPVSQVLNSLEWLNIVCSRNSFPELPNEPGDRLQFILPTSPRENVVLEHDLFIYENKVGIEILKNTRRKKWRLSYKYWKKKISVKANFFNYYNTRV